MENKNYGIYVVEIFNEEIKGNPIKYVYIGSGLFKGKNGSELAKRLYQFENQIKINENVKALFKEKGKENLIIKGRWLLKGLTKTSSLFYESKAINMFKTFEEGFTSILLNIEDPLDKLINFKNLSELYSNLTRKDIYKKY